MTDPIRAAEALAARPLLERVAAMGNCIGQHTVAEIMAISDRAAAWLAENPPGKPIAIEPRGCPTPGACSCVQPEPPAEGEVGELVALIRQIALAWEPDACLLGNMTAGQFARAADLLQHGQSALHRLHRLQQENARFREPERTILCDLLANGTLLPDPDGKRYGVPPVDGEVGEVSDEELEELAEDLEWKRLSWQEGSGPSFALELARAAIALDRSRRAAPGEVE